MKKAIITVGISGSGKSTFASDFPTSNWVEINRDNIRFNYKTPDWIKYKFKKNKENEVTRKQEEMVYKADEHNYNVIISDTNLNPKTRNKWITLLESLDYEVEIKEFPITWDVAVKRNAQREGGVTYSTLTHQYKQWLTYKQRKTYEGTWHKDDAIVFDIDGTLAHMHNRSPFEWDKVGQDSAHEVVKDMLLGYMDRGYKIVLLSGRDGVCKPETETWLDENITPSYDDFFIRTKGDMRKDYIIKEEIFWDAIAPNYNVKAVVDDRPVVCRMWMDLGLKVINVGNPYLEF
jgi:predicted kinase